MGRLSCVTQEGIVSKLWSADGPLQAIVSLILKQLRTVDRSYGLRSGLHRGRIRLGIEQTIMSVDH